MRTFLNLLILKLHRDQSQGSPKETLLAIQETWRWMVPTKVQLCSLVSVYIL